MGALGLRKVSLLVIERGRLPRHAAGGLLGFRVLIVAVLCGSICTVACRPVHVCRIGVSCGRDTSICCDPAGILPSTSGFPVVGVLVGLYASLQCCHQPINPPPGACRRAPKTTNNSSI